MSRMEDALKLAEKTLEQLEVGAGRITPIILPCLRLARLLENRDAELWFRLELMGYGNGGLTTEQTRCAEWSGRRSVSMADGKHMYWVTSIEEIESYLEIARKDLDALQLPSISVSDTGERSYSTWPTASQTILNDVSAKRASKANVIYKWNAVVARLRGAIEDWLSHAVIRLRYGVVVDSVFERTRSRFDALLSQHAPEVGRKLSAAYQRAYDSDPEEWSQALSSCRRAIKALADVVYSPSDQEVDSRSLTDSDYRNRLIQFAAEHLESKSQKKLLSVEISSVVDRVEALDKMANKGVHAEVDERDLELTIVHTYLLAGELLDLLPERQQAEERRPNERLLPLAEGQQEALKEAQDVEGAGERSNH